MNLYSNSELYTRISNQATILSKIYGRRLNLGEFDQQLLAQSAMINVIQWAERNPDERKQVLEIKGLTYRYLETTLKRLARRFLKDRDRVEALHERLTHENSPATAGETVSLEESRDIVAQVREEVRVVAPMAASYLECFERGMRLPSAGRSTGEFRESLIRIDDIAGRILEERYGPKCRTDFWEAVQMLRSYALGTHVEVQSESSVVRDPLVYQALRYRARHGEKAYHEQVRRLPTQAQYILLSLIAGKPRIVVIEELAAKHRAAKPANPTQLRSSSTDEFRKAANQIAHLLPG